MKYYHPPQRQCSVVKEIKVDLNRLLLVKSSHGFLFYKKRYLGFFSRRFFSLAMIITNLRLPASSFAFPICQVNLFLLDKKMWY